MRVTKADWYWLVERMAWVVQAEELPEIEEMVKRTNYGVKLAKHPDFSEQSRTGGKAKVEQD